MNERFVLRAIVVMLVAFPIAAFAQGSTGGAADGTIPDAKPADQTAADATGGSTPAASAAAEQSAPAQQGSAATSTGATPASTPAPAGNTAPSGGGAQPAAPESAATPAAGNASQAPVEINLGTATVQATANTGAGSYVWAIVVGLVLAIIPFGFFAAAWMRKKEPKLSKEEETHNRCFDIENLMKDKLRELTDLKAMAKEKTVEMGKELMRDLVTGTKTGDLLVQIEKAEAQYIKLKKLFEECQVDIDRYAYKGVLIENSLLDKEILNQVRIIRTRDQGEWKLHDIRLSKKQIEDIQKNIVDTKWFFHLWEPGKDRVMVVFKDALFEVVHSDRSTWHEAIKHGLTRGIPKEQLNFEIVQ